MGDPIRPLELEKLAFLEGSWVNTGHVVAGPFGPGGDISGHTTYRWDIGSVWLTYQSQLDLPGLGRYEVVGGVTYDSHRSLYIAYAANSLGKLITYGGKWKTDSRLVFAQELPSAAIATRVTYEKLSGGSVRMLSDRMSDRGEFESYFETDMEPVGSEE